MFSPYDSDRILTKFPQPQFSGNGFEQSSANAFTYKSVFCTISLLLLMNQQQHNDDAKQHHDGDALTEFQLIPFLHACPKRNHAIREHHMIHVAIASCRPDAAENKSDCLFRHCTTSTTPESLLLRFHQQHLLRRMTVEWPYRNHTVERRLL